MDNSYNKVLYIEDDAASRLLVKKVLPSDRFMLFEAANGIEGLRMAVEVGPDLILMDFNLPDISGPELATKIKSLSALKDTVIVALTATQEADAREVALIAGCDGYLTKPIDIKMFPDQLAEFLTGKRETIAEEQQDYFRKKYQVSVVEHLTEKVEQLRETNRLLTRRTARLKNYSVKLEVLLEVTIELQMCNSPQELIRKLVDGICGRFGIDRCAYLEVDHEQVALKVAYAHGFPREEWESFRLKYEEALLHRLFRDKQILYFANRDMIPYQSIREALRSISARHFILGILGIPEQKERLLFAGENAEVLLGSIIPKLYGQTEADVNIIREHLKEYLSSDIFYFNGYLYLDSNLSAGKLAKYDFRILETLLRTASLLYQNLLLREQLKEFFVRAEKEAITDHLTGLYNFRYFRQQLSREFNRAERHKTRFALLMLDIDFFKMYNDTFGHQAGDIVLKKVAELLVQNTRGSDFVARYGGEEFVVISPELDKAEGKKIADKLCQIVAESPFPPRRAVAAQECDYFHRRCGIPGGRQLGS